MRCPGLLMHRRFSPGWAVKALFIVICVLTNIAGCVPVKQKPASEDLVTQENVLTESIKNESDPSLLSDYYLRRAHLRIRADNPLGNYNGALGDLKMAVDLKPELSKGGGVMDWIAVLGRLGNLDQEAAQLKAKNEQVERQNRALRGNVEQLEKQDQELHKTIEELKSLELEREQRRQQLR